MKKNDDTERWTAEMNELEGVERLRNNRNPLVRFLENERRRLNLRVIEKNLKPGTQFADVGAGDGEFTRIILERNPHVHVVALDIDRRMLEKQKAFIKNRNFRIVHSDAQRIELKNNSMDVVFLGCVLSHVAKPEKAISEVERVLKPGGVAIYQVPNDDIILKAKGLVSKAGIGKYFPGVHLGLAKSHIRTFNEKKACEMIGKKHDKLSISTDLLRFYIVVEAKKSRGKKH